MLTYKGRVVKNEKSFEELLKENVYLTSMLKQKEGQLEAAERSWQEKLQQVLRQTQGDDDEEESTLPTASLHPTPTVPAVPGVPGASGASAMPAMPSRPMVAVVRGGET